MGHQILQRLSKSHINQWERSKITFNSVEEEEALLDFLSQVTRFILERNG